MGTNIARKWRDLSGRSNWKSLLDPLNIDLGRYIIHYGQLAQATYDAFISDKASKHAGNTRYPKEDFFSKVGLETVKYSVTKFLYATSKANAPEAFILKSLASDAWSTESNWMGYVAVATDEGKAALGRRDIVVAWRGTIQASEWLKDLHFHLAPAPQIFGDDDHSPALLHHGFYSIYTSDDTASQFTNTSARIQVLEEIRRLLEEYKEEEISISVTGHSLGGALATMNAVDIVANGFNNVSKERACPVTAFVFACPRVGNSEFHKIFCGYKDLRELRIRNKPDIVPDLPVGYCVVGEELVIDTEESKLHLWKISSHHLMAYLHGIVATLVLKNNNLEVNGGVARVDKSTEKNKGTVQQVHGTWKIMGHNNEDDIPSIRPRL